MAKQAETGAQWVEDDAGRKFLQGTVCVYFKRDAGEARCREIAEELGGLWVDDSFAIPTGIDFADATVFFSSLSDGPYESLEAVRGGPAVRRAAARRGLIAAAAVPAAW